MREDSATCFFPSSEIVLFLFPLIHYTFVNLFPERLKFLLHRSIAMATEAILQRLITNPERLKDLVDKAKDVALQSGMVIRTKEKPNSSEVGATLQICLNCSYMFLYSIYIYSIHVHDNNGPFELEGIYPLKITLKVDPVTLRKSQHNPLILGKACLELVLVTY